MADPTEIRALIVTTRANVVMAVAAIAGVGVTGWYSRQTVDVAKNTLAESKKNGEAQERFAAQTLVDAEKSRKLQDEHSQAQWHLMRDSLQQHKKDSQVQQAQYQEEQRLNLQRVQDERQKWNEEREEAERLAQEARAPHLAHHCCSNPVAVIVRRRGTEKPIIGLPVQEIRSQLPTNLNAYDVVQIVNHGRGPALSVRAIWHPELVTMSDGSTRHPTYDGRNDSQTAPFYVPPGENASIKHMPRCYYTDVGDKFGEVKGYLELKCTDTAGKDYSFKYNFTMVAVMDVGEHTPFLRAGDTVGSLTITIAERPSGDEPKLTPLEKLEREPAELSPIFQ